MGTAGGEGFVPAFCGADSQYGDNDASVRSEDKKETQECHSTYVGDTHPVS